MWVVRWWYIELLIWSFLVCSWFWLICSCWVSERIRWWRYICIGFYYGMIDVVVYVFWFLLILFLVWMIWYIFVGGRFYWKEVEIWFKWSWFVWGFVWFLMLMKFLVMEMVYLRRFGSCCSWIECCEFVLEYENLLIFDDGCVEEFVEICD